MNNQPQEQDPQLLEAARNFEKDEFGRLLNLLADLKLVDQPDVDQIETKAAQPYRPIVSNQFGALSHLPETDGQPDLMASTALLTPDGKRHLLKPPPPPPSIQPSSKTAALAPLSPEPLKPSAEMTDAFEQLQGLLVGSELTAFRDLTTRLEQKLASLEHQIYEPAALINLLLPWVAELLTRKIAESKKEMVQTIAPIIDQAIQSRGEQDKASMSAAIAPLLAAAISQQTNQSPEEVANAIAPTIDRAIKEQIRLEQDAMVDALYPIIGSTIAKYMAEAIQSINQQIENTLSPEGIQRKIRAKFQGVSEAELILKQAIPFTVQAIFLIHKASGLLIAEVQPGDQSLESEMLAGMLTAIRSFANDCMAQAGRTSELDQINYGGAKIILEVAGYCYSYSQFG